MIRKLIHILLAVIGTIILTSKSCAPEPAYDAETRMRVKQDSVLNQIRSNFVTEYLLEEELVAYGEKARQKLFDLADYLNLYAAEDMDSLWKNQAKEMIYRLFFSRDAVISLQVEAAQKDVKKENRISDLLKDLDASGHRSFVFAIADMRTLEPLHQEGVGRYAGKLGCRFSILALDDQDTTLLNETYKEVTILTTHTSKQFGSAEPMQVWQVFLGEIADVK
jgi:hypothetical protein